MVKKYGNLIKSIKNIEINQYKFVLKTNKNKRYKAICLIK